MSETWDGRMPCEARYEGDASCDPSFVCWGDPERCIRKPVPGAGMAGMPDVEAAERQHIAPPFDTLKGVQFFAKDSDGQWHYVNHAGAWQTCPPPADHAAALAAAEMRGREEAVRAIRAHRFACEFYPVGRSRGVPMLSPSAFKDQAAEVLRAMPPPPGTDALDARLREERRKVWEEAARIARDACLVPPDGGAPTEEERAVCEEAERRIRARMEADDAAE